LLDAGNLPVDRKTKVRPLNSHDSQHFLCELTRSALQTIGQSETVRRDVRCVQMRRGRSSFRRRREVRLSHALKRCDSHQLRSLASYSETVPHLSALKDGASWAALEFGKNIRDPLTRRMLSDGSFTNKEPQDVVICIAGIGYSDKTKYRSSATMECVFSLQLYSIAASPDLSRLLVQIRHKDLGRAVYGGVLC
jgi:hypothetical protein